MKSLHRTPQNRGSRGASGVILTARPGCCVRREVIGRLETGCRSGIRTRDLLGMNQLSYRCSILLRNGWSVMIRRRRPSITRRGNDGRILNTERFNFQAIE